MKNRFLKTLLLCLVLAAAFFALYVFYSFTGFGVPCPFYAVTGRMCPACGTFRMLAALARADFTAAAAFNPVMLAVLPLLVIFFASYAARYVALGTKQLNKAQNVLAVMIIAPLIVFGFIRLF